MTVHFIGAGPGAADLITVRGLRIISESPVVLYAGALVPRELVEAAPAGARLVDTAELNLDEIVEELRAAHAAGLDVARLQSGDTSFFSAVAEQQHEHQADGEHAGEWLILEEGMKAKPFMASARDAQFDEMRKRQAEEVSRFTGVPRPLLMFDETSWGSGNEQLGRNENGLVMNGNKITTFHSIILWTSTFNW